MQDAITGAGGAADTSWLCETTLGALLARAAGSPRGVRFLDRRERATYLTYDELHRRAAACAAGMRAAGVAPGDRVGLILATGPWFFDAFFGAVLAGAIPVPVYPPVRLGRLDEYHVRTAAMLRSVQARLVVTEPRIRRVLGATIEQMRPELGCVTADGLRDGARPGPADGGPGRGDDVVLIQMSSGTTREPKPICLTHRQVLSNVARINGGILTSYPEEDGLTHAGVSWLPLYHDMGLVGCVLTSLAHPADLTLIPPEAFIGRPALWLRAISRHRGTISPAPNFAYSLCTDRIDDDELEGVDLSSWRIALNGAEPVTPTVLERFVERFARHGLRPEALTPVYGLAEAALAVTFSEVRRPFRWTGFDRAELAGRGVARPAADGVPLVSLGRPLPGFALRIVDAERAELPQGRCGRVLVRGPSVMEGYHRRPADTAAALRDGWLDTGDLGFVHRGELYLYGREKDIIILRGRNYSPQEFEQCLDGLEGVRTGCSAAIGVVPPGGPGEQLVLLVERARRAQAETDSELARRVRGRLADRLGVVPDRVDVLEPGTLPRTSSGKIRRADARRAYQHGGGLAPPRRVTTLRMMRELVRSGLGFARARRGHPAREGSGQ